MLKSGYGSLRAAIQDLFKVCPPPRASGTTFFDSVSVPFMTECRLDAPVYLRTIDGAMVLPQSSDRRQLLAILASTCAEAGLLAYAAGYFVMAVLLGGTSSAVLSWSSTSSNIDDPRLARYIAVRSVLALAMILLTTTTVIPHLRKSHLFHGSPGSSPTPITVYTDHHARKSGSPRSDLARPSPTDIRDAYSGIVLWPKSRQ